jgi:hypothetical protein
VQLTVQTQIHIPLLCRWYVQPGNTKYLFYKNRGGGVRGGDEPLFSYTFDKHDT